MRRGSMRDRARVSGIRLTVADAGIIKAMLLRGDRQHDVAAWFGVNGGRIAEIASGYRFSEIQADLKAVLPPFGPCPRAGQVIAAMDALVAAKQALATAERALTAHSIPLP